MKTGRRLHAFTTVEMMTGLIVIALIFAAMTMKSGSSRQSIRREAERVAAFINRLMSTADRNRNPFSLRFVAGSFSIIWSYSIDNTENLRSFPKNKNYKLSSNVDLLHYSIKNHNFSQGGTITLTKIISDDISDMDKYYVIIAAIGGRVRTSPNPPENWNIPNNNYVY